MTVLLIEHMGLHINRKPNRRSEYTYSGWIFPQKYSFSCFVFARLEGWRGGELFCFLMFALIAFNQAVTVL